METGINMSILNETTPKFKEQDKEQVWKYTVSYQTANADSLSVLQSHGVEIKKPSQVIVLAYPADELDRKLKLAEEMGFVNAYKQNPRHLSQPVESVIKRMSKAEAEGIPLTNEKGTYSTILFSERAFDYVTKQNSKNDSPSIPPINSQVDSQLMAETKENALRVLEAFAMTDEKDQVYARLDAIGDKGLSQKEMLVEAFKVFGGDEKLLVSTIDDVLAASEEMKRGMAA